MAALRVGSAGGVLSTVNQIGGSVGVALLGSFFVFHIAADLADGTGTTRAFGDTFAATLPVQVGLYLAAAALMTLLPTNTHARTAAAPSGRRPRR